MGLIEVPGSRRDGAPRQRGLRAAEREGSLKARDPVQLLRMRGHDSREIAGCTPRELLGGDGRHELTEAFLARE